MYNKVVQIFKDDVNVWHDILILRALKSDAENRKQEILGFKGMRTYPSV
jgi:hypothetical protein